MTLAGAGTAPDATQRVVRVSRVGRERRVVAIMDGMVADPDGLRRAALAAPWGPARAGYPGVRAPLPPAYLAEIAPLVAQTLHDLFGVAAARLIDACFAMVTAAPAELALEQRVPHVDATAPGRFAFVHYLVPGGGDGTGFFRHRATGYECITDARAADYHARLSAEARGGLPPAYIAGSTALFEQTALIDGAWNRAVLYESALLHSGAITAQTVLSPDPARGRLTVTGFLAAA